MALRWDETYLEEEIAAGKKKSMDKADVISDGRMAYNALTLGGLKREFDDLAPS